MDTATLVAWELAKGGKVLEILDRAGMKIPIALWVHLPDYEDWRFLLASPQFDRAAPAKPYRLVRDALDKEGFPVEQTPTLLIYEMNTPFIRSLRRLYGKAKNTEGMRLGPETIGDRYLQDALVYRIQ